MSEENAKKGPEFSIHRIYVKDISFEAPNSPFTFKEEWQPVVDINLDTVHQVLEGDIYDVTVSITVTTKLKDTPVFIAEVKQAGIFVLSNFNDTQKDELLNSFCPNVLFPYVREVVSDLVNRGGFPPLYLAPINFDALYQEKKKTK
jgi:preprotein translocase subunit SecB